jgi:hypothetical protein
VDATEVPVSDEKPKGELDALFELLVPPDEVTIEDVWGGTYRVPGRIPALRQIVVMRIVKDILTHRAAAETLNAMGGMPQGADGIAKGIAHLAFALGDEDLVSRFAEAFAEAHPQVLAKAQGAAAARGDGDNLPAVQLFAVEEMAAALAPLFVRLGRRLLDGVRGMAPLQPTA